MCAHEYAHRSVRKTGKSRLLLRLAAKTAQDLDARTEGGKALGKGGVVLLGEDGRRAQDHHLPLVGNCLERSAQGHLRFAKAHVAADQAVHGTVAFHVGLHVGNGRELVGGLGIGEEPLHLLLPGSVARIGKSLGRGASRVEVHEVEGQLARAFSRLGRRARPIRRVQAGETRRRAARADVAGDTVYLLDGHVELVGFRIRQQHVVALGAGHLLAHEAGKQRYAVARVHHVVARREGKARLGDVDAAGTASGGAAGGGAAGEIVDGDDGQVRVVDEKTGRHVDISDV